MDDSVDMMKEIALQIEKLNEIAYNQYKPIVSDLNSYREIGDTE